MNEYREWGKWVRDNPDCLKTKSTWLMVERSKLPVSRCVYVMTDDRGLQIDRGVSELARYCPVSANVFMMFYVWGWSHEKIAVRYLSAIGYRGKSRASRHDVRSALIKAESFLAGLLHKLYSFT